eukprot:2810963-Pyramimonas_sp.AAC.1
MPWPPPLIGLQRRRDALVGQLLKVSSEAQRLGRRVVPHRASPPPLPSTWSISVFCRFRPPEAVLGPGGPQKADPGCKTASEGSQESSGDRL